MKTTFKFLLNTIPRPWLIALSAVVKPLLIFWYKGTQYTDPIDNQSFRKLIPYGYKKSRENALSPSTYSLERHRLLWLFLKSDTDFFSKAKKVLHFAPEQAFYKRFRKIKSLDYLTVDLNSPIADIKADICQLPFNSNSFDFILCNHVLEHINDDLKAMHELFRVMKPGGMGVFQIPLDINRKTTFEDNSIINRKQRTKIFGQYDHVRIYGMDYFNRLETCGFRVEKVDYTKTLSDKEISKYCLIKGEIIPVVYKPN